MFAHIANSPFKQFDRGALSSEETEVLDGGIVKHVSILKWVAVFLPFQLLIAVLAPEIVVLMTAVSFISMMLGTAWYAISFQNVSEAQLVAGVADYITKKMFRAFMISFNTLIICALVFTLKLMIPELKPPPMDEVSLLLRLVLLLGNLSWLLLVWADVYFASVAYDAADSLLGDGFPTLMRGAKANHKNSPMVKILSAMAEKQGVDVNSLMAEDDESPRKGQSD